jgi:1,4-alpha-glucan branching enzyme
MDHATREMFGNQGDIDRILQFDHDDPHAILGPHAAIVNEVKGVAIRSFQPQTAAMSCIIEGSDTQEMRPLGNGMFAAFFPKKEMPVHYQLHARMPDGASRQFHDAYAFIPVIGELDLYLFNEGTHRRIWEIMGAHLRTIDSTHGTLFTVWAPHARRVSVI